MFDQSLVGITPASIAADDAGAATETKIGSVRLPANTFTSGRFARQRGRLRVTGANAGDTGRVRVRLGADDLTGTLLCDTGNVELAADGLIDFEVDLHTVTDDASSGLVTAKGRSNTGAMRATALDQQTLNAIDSDAAASESAVFLGLVDTVPTLLCHNPDDLDFFVTTEEGDDALALKHQRGLVADTLDFNHAASPGGQALWIALVEGESARDGFVLATDDSGGGNQDCLAFTEIEAGDGINVYNLAAAALSAYVQVYYDEDATAGSTLLANLSTITGGADIVLRTAYGRKVIIRHSASPGTPGVAVNAVCSSGTATFAYISPTTTSVSCPILPSVDQVTPLRFDEDGDGFVADLDDLGLGGDAAFVTLAGGVRKLKVTDKEGTADPAIYADPDAATDDERLLFVSPTDADGTQTTTEDGLGAADAVTDVKLSSWDTRATRYAVVSVEFSSANAANIFRLDHFRHQVDPDPHIPVTA